MRRQASHFSIHHSVFIILRFPLSLRQHRAHVPAGFRAGPYSPDRSIRMDWAPSVVVMRSDVMMMGWPMAWRP